MVQTSDPPSGPGRTTEAWAERRLEILRRAAAVFREKGFQGAGMREIAEGLGLAPGALYYYFPSKTDLLYACQAVSLDRLIEGARRVAREGGPAPERLRRLVDHHLEVILDVLGGSAAHLEFGALPPERRREIVRRRDAYERIVRKVIREGGEDGTLRVVDEKTTAMALLGALNWTVVWWRPEGKRTTTDLGRTYADLFLRGLRPGSAQDEQGRTP
jgi:AcrR family transcriptional regulator